MTQEEKLIFDLRKYDRAYEGGSPIISDVQYDIIKKDAYQKFPKNPYFMEVGSDVRGGKERLPYPLGSLDQIYENEIKNWVNKNNLRNEKSIITEKLDGVSGLVIYKNGKLFKAYSRGNGIEGADITRHLIKIPSLPQEIEKNIDYLAIRGEIIIETDTFNQKYSKNFKNGRNMVAGCMNRKETEPSVLSDIDFIAYDILEMYHNGYNTPIKDKFNQIRLLSKLKFKTPIHGMVSLSDLNDDLLTKILKNYKKDSEYELDGIVISIKNLDFFGDKSRKSQSLNPQHSVKYKVLDEESQKTTTVKQVHWEISKTKKLKPRVEIDPVELFGTTVTYATGFNAKFIYENGIGPDAKIKITKSGAVIPYILGVESSVEPSMPIEAWCWDDNKVEAILEEDSDEATIKDILAFFVSIEVEQLRDSSIRKIIEQYVPQNPIDYTNALEIILDLDENEWKNTIGENGRKIYNSLHRRLNSMPLFKLVGSLSYCGIGFGVRKSKILFKQLKNENEFWGLSEEDIVNFEGFQEKSAKRVFEGIPFVKKFLEENSDYINLVKEEVKENLAGLNVVMTGFRDKGLKEKIESLGGNVKSSVSSKTTHLLTLDISSNSSKMKTARENNVKIMDPEDFKIQYNL